MDDEALPGQILAPDPVLYNLALLVFVAGAIMMGAMIKKENSFSNVQTILATLGLKRFRRTWQINLGHVLTIVIPTALMALSIFGALRTAAE